MYYGINFEDNKMTAADHQMRTYFKYQKQESVLGGTVLFS